MSQVKFNSILGFRPGMRPQAPEVLNRLRGHDDLKPHSGYSLARIIKRVNAGAVKDLHSPGLWLERFGQAILS